jgi:hypothetical protein
VQVAVEHRDVHAAAATLVRVCQPDDAGPDDAEVGIEGRAAGSTTRVHVVDAS